MPENPLVSIIIRTKNRNSFLKRAINSVENQTFKRWKAYIINDGGSDSYIKELEQSFDKKRLDRFVFINMPISSGRGSALSIGLSSSSEKYVLIHDDDDTLEPTFLEKTVAYLEADKEDIFSGVTTSNYDVYEEISENDILIHKKTNEYGLKEGAIIDLSTYLSSIGVIIPISFLFKKSCIKSIGNIDTNMNYMEDYDLFLRIMQCGEVGIISDFLCSYHHRKPTGTDADTSHHEKNYDYRLAYRNNVIRDAIKNKSPLKVMQAYFINEKSINSFFTHQTQQQIELLHKQVGQLTIALSGILEKIYR